MILSAHISGIAKSAASLSKVVTNLNCKESNRMNFSASTSTLFMALLLLGNLFWAKYRYRSLKYGLVKKPAWISLIVIGKYVPFSTFLSITSYSFSMSFCFGKNLCTILVVSSKSANSGGSLM